MTPTGLAAEFVADLNRVIIFPTIALLTGVAFLVFLWGCFLYIAKSDDPSARAKGVSSITWGIIGLVVMISAYAILSIVVATFGLDDELRDANDGLPQLNPQGSNTAFPADDSDSQGDSNPF